ncbi:MAG: hypothetical protein LBQ12_12670 [Deltaproteobacteria bacterium]|jgi:23S rRNA (uridine2552-2'-O)-methyltransferase|nr:hypothetical protein [Deltaproteobacteria bacterium]
MTGTGWAALAARARKEGYPVRSAYKLTEMDEKHKLLGKGMRVLGLGLLEPVRRRQGGHSGKVLGLDVKPLSAASRPNLEFMAGDALDLSQGGIPVKVP